MLQVTPDIPFPLPWPCFPPVSVQFQFPQLHTSAVCDVTSTGFPSFFQPFHKHRKLFSLSASFPNIVHGKGHPRLTPPFISTGFPVADVFLYVTFVIFRYQRFRVRLKRDGTRAETRFRLSPKRTSPFKSVGASVQLTAGSRGVRSAWVRLYRPRSEAAWEYWLPTPFASFPFTSPPVPPGSERALRTA